MRAIVANKLGPPEDLVIEEINSLQPGPGQVVVDNRAAAIGVIFLLWGKIRSDRRYPFLPGKEGAGVIKAGPASTG